MSFGPSRSWAGTMCLHLIRTREHVERDRKAHALKNLDYLIERFHAHASGEPASGGTRRRRP